MRETHFLGAEHEEGPVIQAKQIHRIPSGGENGLFPTATLLPRPALRQWRKPSRPGQRQPRSGHIGLLPNNYSHAEQEKRPDFNVVHCRYPLQHPPDLIHSVSPAHGSRRVMPGDAAAIKRQAQIAQSKMQRVALQVMNKKGVACHAESLAGEAHNFIRFKMMQEEGAAHNVKAVVRKGKSESIAANARKKSAKVGR